MLATPVRMHNFARGDFGDRTVSSLHTIVDNPVQILSQSRANTETPTHTHLDILSASRYPHALIPGYDSDHVSLKRKQPHHAGSTQLYGGLLRKSDSPEVSNDSSLAEKEAAPSRPKKRVRKSKKDEDEASEESKRQRGRPRLDTRDENAADRRRTQIRLAQRAYRHRKETTISALKQRVTALQATIEQMNKTFLDLHDNLIEAGITTSHVRLARQLKMATQEFVSLAKIAEEENDEEETKIAENTGTGNGNGAHDNQFEAEPDSHSTNVDQQSSQRDNLANNAEAEEIPLVSHTYPYSEHSSWGISTDIVSFRADVPEPQIDIEKLLGEKARHAAAVLFPSSTIDYPISSPAGKNGSYTYSFQETNFSRRLHRRSLESGWRNLTNPQIDPAVLNRVFRFTFCFTNRKRMVARFKDLLQRKAGEALENWNVPFFNVGGAGTHFPRRDTDGKPIYPPNMLSPERALVSQDMGPYKHIGVGAETPRVDANDVPSLLEAIGYGGEWFDSHDVEEYLKTKGIFLDGQSSFVEVDPSVILPRLPTRSQTTSSVNSSLTSPSDILLRTPSPTMPTDQNITMADADDLFTQQEMNEFYPSTFVSAAAPNFTFTNKELIDFPPRPQEQLSVSQVYDQQIWPWHNDGSLFDNADVSALFPQLTSTAQAPATTYTQPLTLDVERFVENLVEGGACLGRAPGFRKELVENALALSVTEGF